MTSKGMHLTTTGFLHFVVYNEATLGCLVCFPLLYIIEINMFPCKWKHITPGKITAFIGLFVAVLSHGMLLFIGIAYILLDVYSDAAYLRLYLKCTDEHHSKCIA